jgi:hypothetical protein
MNLIILVLVLLLSGCSSSPYIQIGIGYQLDGATDWYLQTDRDWTCNNKDTFHGEVGTTWDNGWSIGYHHQSHTSCGRPFNKDPELYKDEILVTKRWTAR